MAVVSLDQVMRAVEDDDNIGFCLACGAERDGCEPDARNYECEVCGEMKVFGAEEILLMGVAL
jgi:hypothetical protein